MTERGRHSVASVVFVGVLAACGPTADRPGGTTDPPPRPIVRLGLERTPCFGFCPEYQLTAAADGEIVFRGLHRWQGVERRWRVPADSVATLGAELAQLGFFALRDIVPDTPGCGDVATDHPSIVLSASDGARDHAVRYYTGCRGTDSVPSRLTRLAGRIDTLTGAAGLVDSLRSARPSVP